MVSLSSPSPPVVVGVVVEEGTTLPVISPPAISSPHVAVLAVPGRCTWLVTEALRLEAKAVDFDRSGTVKQAVFNYRLACGKLTEAISLCPDGHPDGPTLRNHLLEMSTRAVYLESLGNSHAKVSIEDHISEVALVMNLASAPLPDEEKVSTVLARSGMSGETATLTEAGYQLVVALKSPGDMAAFVKRLVKADGQRIQRGEEEALHAFAGNDGCAQTAGSLAMMQDMLFRTPWVELDVDPKSDKLELAVELEKAAKKLETQNRIAAAVNMHQRALALFEFVHNYDNRSKNPKIKNMIAQRIEEVKKSIECLQAVGVDA